MARAARPLTAVRAGEAAAATSAALALGVILSAQLLVVLNVSIVNVALPSIQGGLDLSATGTQWLVTAYAKMIENLAWATGHNVIAIPVAAGLFVPWGIDLPMSLGAIAMSASTIIVAANAQLLRRLTLRHEPSTGAVQVGMIGGRRCREPAGPTRRAAS